MDLEEQSMMAAIEKSELHVVFLPFITRSHMIPSVDAARLFAAHGVKAAVITIPANAALFQSSIDHAIRFGHKICVCSLAPVSGSTSGLTEGIENFGAATSTDMLIKVHDGQSLLKEPMENLILGIGPHCIFSDMFYPWTNDVAEKLNIPRLLFYPNNFFCHCLRYNLEIYGPHEKVNSDSETFLIPRLPHKIEMKRSQLEEHAKIKTRYGEMIKIIKESELRCHGMVQDTVYDLETEYGDYYKRLRGKKYWTIGPIFNLSDREKANAPERHSCFEWLDTQKANTVVFICFGSMVRFSNAQPKDISLALESADQPFIWVVRNEEKTQKNEPERWLPHGFEEKLNMSKRGLIIRSWCCTIAEAHKYLMQN